MRSIQIPIRWFFSLKLDYLVSQPKDLMSEFGSSDPKNMKINMI